MMEGRLRERWDLKGEISDSGLYGLLRTDHQPPTYSPPREESR
jgi:hypothetical protein